MTVPLRHPLAVWAPKPERLRLRLGDETLPMNDAAILDKPADLTRSRRLKAATNTSHDRLDKTIMSHEPFSSRDRYGRFVAMQHAFHYEIDGLYDDPALDAV